MSVWVLWPRSELSLEYQLSPWSVVCRKYKSIASPLPISCAPPILSFSFSPSLSLPYSPITFLSPILFASSLLLFFLFWLCPSSPKQVLGKVALELVLWALWSTGAGPEPSREGCARTEADDHWGGATLETCLQHQCCPLAGHQHLPLGLFCMIPQTWLQCRQTNKAQVCQPQKQALLLLCCLNWRPQKSRLQDPLRRIQLNLHTWRVEKQKPRESTGFVPGHPAGVTWGFPTLSDTLPYRPTSNTLFPSSCWMCSVALLNVCLEVRKVEDTRKGAARNLQKSKSTFARRYPPSSSPFWFPYLSIFLFLPIIYL